MQVCCYAGAEKRMEFARALQLLGRRNLKASSIAEEMIKLRTFAIASGYEDGNDCNTLRIDPIFKRRLPCTGERDPLCSQPTMSDGEYAVEDRDGRAMWRLWMFCESYRRAPASITLDIDELRHGARLTLSFFQPLIMTSVAFCDPYL